MEEESRGLSDDCSITWIWDMGGYRPIGLGQSIRGLRVYADLVSKTLNDGGGRGRSSCPHLPLQ